MKVILSIPYSELFDEDMPALEDLIKDIPSKTIIAVLSVINSQVYLGHDFKTQIDIFRRIMARQSEETNAKILNKLVPRNPTEPPIYLFSLLYTTEFIHYEISHFRDFEFSDTTPDQELRLFKAYFVIVERVNQKYSDSFKFSNGADEESFRKTTWPSLIDQFGVNHIVHPFTQFPKGISFFNYLQFHSPYKIYVDKFLKKRGKASAWNYVMDLIMLIYGHWAAHSEAEADLMRFSIWKTEGYHELLESFSISPSEYRELYLNNKGNFAGLKDKPLFSLDNDRYLVLNWNFLAGKLYDGLLFDFYSQSGISGEDELKTFLSFKSRISTELTEKCLFRKLIKKYFNRRHTIVLFDEKKIAGFPDAYIRDSRYIFLIEIKDSLFDSHSVNSMSYDTIKDSIDKKYNTHNKGTGQIIKQIEVLIDGTFEARSFDSLNIKRKNLVIYPLIIFTDNSFNMPGINSYLAEELQKKSDDKGLSNYFGAIEPLTLINLSFLIEQIHLTKKPDLRIKDLIDSFHRRIKGIKKRHRKKRTLANHISMNDPFESLVSPMLKRLDTQSSEYVKVVASTLDLTENLPTE